MNDVIMVINDNNCRVLKKVGDKLEAIKIKSLPADLVDTLNKYMVSDQLDFDLKDDELDRSNLEQSEGSIEDKRLKMIDDALNAISPVLSDDGHLKVLSSNRYTGKMREKLEKFDFDSEVVEFIPSGSTRTEENQSIVDKLN